MFLRGIIFLFGWKCFYFIFLKESNGKSHILNARKGEIINWTHALAYKLYLQVKIQRKYVLLIIGSITLEVCAVNI